MKHINERSAVLLAGWVSGISFGLGCGLGSPWFMLFGLVSVSAVGIWVAKLETNEWLRELRTQGELNAHRL